MEKCIRLKLLVWREPLLISKNMQIKQLCSRKVREFAIALRARKVSGAFKKREPAGAFGPKSIFGDFGDFQAGCGPHLEKAFGTRKHAFVSTSVAFYDIFARACAAIKIFVLFFNLFCLSFLTFSYLFAAVIDLLLVSLSVQKLSKRAIFSME